MSVICISRQLRMAGFQSAIGAIGHIIDPHSNRVENCRTPRRFWPTPEASIAIEREFGTQTPPAGTAALARSVGVVGGSAERCFY